MAISGCAGPAPTDGPPSPSTSSSSTTAVTSASTSPDAVEGDSERAGIESLLRRRSRAVVRDDRSGFLALAAPSGRGRQSAWFERIAPLSLTTFRYELGTRDAAASEGGTYVADVDEFTQVADFDRSPVWTSHRMTFVRQGGRWLVAADDVDDSEILSAPWEFPGIRIQQSDHVLLATDAQALRQSPQMFSMLGEARDYVDARTDGPLDAVVFLALSDVSALRAEGMNTDELNRVGAVTTGVRGADFGVVEQRVIVAPSSLASDTGYEQVMLRHELVHIALARYGRTSPTWLTEGIAEYVAHQGLELRLSSHAIALAREHRLTMPANGLFYRGDDGDNSPNYAVAWWSLEYLASLKGSDEPFRLLEAFRQAKDATDFDAMSALLEKRYGMTADELASHAQDLIVSTWAGVVLSP